MNILELIPIIKSITGIKTCMLASQYEANVALDKIPNADYPIFVIYENIPSDEQVQKDGSILTTYKPFIHFLDRCELDTNYVDKQTIKERLSTLIRKLIVDLNKRKEIKDTMKFIERFEIFRDLDTLYDRNLVCAGFVMELPHVDTSVILCTPYVPVIKIAQTITFAPIGELQVGDIITLNAVASSGLTVLYFSSNPLVATITNNTLTVVGVGNVTITASQLGNSIFYPASVGQAIMINTEPYETNLVFDFDFTQTSKQTLRDSLYLTNYVDRGVSMVQATASNQPIIDAQGLKFDGVDDFMLLGATGGQEICIVVNNLDGAVFNSSDGLFATPLTSVDYAYGDATTSNFRFPKPSMKINNIFSTDFSPLGNFKTVSQELEVGNSLYIGNLFDAVYWNGYIKRILIFNEILSEPRRTALQAYLANTYNL